MKPVRRMLEQQADAIEAVLAEHKAAARVTGGFVLPECIRFVLAPESGVEANQVLDLTDAIARALQQPETRVYYENRMLQVEIPRPAGADAEPPAGAKQIPPELAAMFGADTTGAEQLDLVHTLLESLTKHRR